jgi:hypothetical protein
MPDQDRVVEIDSIEKGTQPVTVGLYALMTSPLRATVTRQIEGIGGRWG